LNLQHLTRLIRSHWFIIAVTTLAAVLISIVITLLTTPLYQASTRMFVSTTSGASATDLYQGNRLSQDRVISYTELIKGETLAQRTVDKLGLDVGAETLRSRIQATSKPGTVLINVKVLDESPVRARDIADALSDEFVVMVKELETLGPGSRPDARVVVEQRASVPEKPVVPKRARNIALGLFGGLTLGALLGLLRDVLDNTVKTEESLEEITGAGVVGIIPFDKNCRDQPAISFDTDNSGIAEAFRKLRTNLQFLAVDNPPHFIVVLSSTPNEGKSTTAINLALALAEAEKSVVLVDGDMRRPTLHLYLGLVGAVGFSTVLSGGATLDEALQDTKYPRLSVLAAGPTPPNPSELIGSKAARKTLNELRSRFDFVIVDSPPLLAVTDGAIWSTFADGALIIAKFGETKRDQLEHAVGNLRDVGATVLGAVFTMVRGRGPGSYNYYYSGRYGRYGETAAPVAATEYVTEEPVEYVTEEPVEAADPEAPRT
jgi:receptor protein-tyrosine kinase